VRILLTRPAEDGAATARCLSEAGHQAVLVPATMIAATGHTPPDAPFEAVIVTSGNAIRHLDPDSARHLRTLPLYCVGEKTATVARQAGFTAITQGPGDGRALVERLGAHLSPPAHLLYLTGTPRKPHVEADLHARGFETTIVELYATRPVVGWPGDQKAAVEDTALAMHFSRASVEALLHAAEAAGLMPHLARLPHLCLSADVAAPLRASGIHRIDVAEKPTEDAMLALLASKKA
jgi:uroporphyrinogen-III synthase